MVPAVLIGAVLSTLYTLPLAWPLQASATDVAWLASLGLFQLAVPCVLVVVCARVLPAPEISLLALLEVLFGIALAWLGARRYTVLACGLSSREIDRHGRQSAGRTTNIPVRGWPREASSGLGGARSGAHVQLCHELDVHEE
jgi:hypothetical protein